ncbi:uncharacterized protein DUF4291 [Chitinophaga dinghuensis]|uniref:Uncharacterized protein DUF4291 n=1 Tax=Chitinophaga dinghuensis TaxID=1539050 RepID=A0A327VQ12_9BACT|nr:DUF4291 domain-containing protein [Chitinophaga dinghuensis]RAJ75648.1 uncharacterized protein DUF4291 [Chitinophaga dinghuensis]
MTTPTIPMRQIRAHYTESTIRVYQAYRSEIATKAVTHQRFVAPFKLERTTWIKPSFCWMMYRCGWGLKEGQEHILAIDLTHEGFLAALEDSVLAKHDLKIHGSAANWASLKEKASVVVQWDPERDMHLNQLDYRSIQIGLTPPAARKYVTNWVVKIEDITAQCHEIRSLIQQKDLERARALMPEEQVFTPGESIRARLGMDI